jgi:hypothetical protein
MKPGRVRYGMKVDFQYALALSNWGFMSFRRARSGQPAVLAMPA